MRLIDADALKERAFGKRGGLIHTSDIDAMPTIEPIQWIPCSERMPEELEEVNVTWVNHKPEPYYDFVKDKPFTASAVYYKGDWYWYSSVCIDLLAECGENEIDKIDDAIEITAWMPLPEPWRGESKAMPELKPCPFCGGKAELLIKPHIPSVSHKNEYTPRCRNTSCAGRLAKVWLSREKAIEAWNRRVE